MRYIPGLVKRAGDVHRDGLSIPLLAFIQRNYSLEASDHYSTETQTDGPSVLKEWTHGDLITAHMLGLNHGFLTSLYQRNEDTWRDLEHVWPTMQGDYGREDAMVGYAWVARYTRIMCLPTSWK